jgi:hypothetical protein
MLSFFAALTSHLGHRKLWTVAGHGLKDQATIPGTNINIPFFTMWGPSILEALLVLWLHGVVISYGDDPTLTLLCTINSLELHATGNTWKQKLHTRQAVTSSTRMIQLNTQSTVYFPLSPQINSYG